MNQCPQLIKCMVISGETYDEILNFAVEAFEAVALLVGYQMDMLSVIVRYKSVSKLV